MILAGRNKSETTMQNLLTYTKLISIKIVDYSVIFAKDFKDFNESYTELSLKLKERVKELPIEKQKILVGEMEVLTKRMEKLMKSL